jgi:enoyl-[acyl-carrier protein] reductase I
MDLSGKVAVVMGVANQRSIAWGVTQALHRANAGLALTYVGEKFGATLQKLTSDMGEVRLYECNVAEDEQIDAAFAAIADHYGRIDMIVHSVAFAPREELAGRFVDTTREGFKTALDISAYSLIRVAHAAHPHMTEGGSIVTMSYLGAQRVIPKYNVMGTAKAALENTVRQLAYDLGPENVRVNAISAGPVNTLSARGVRDFSDMLKHHRDIAPLKRNVTLEEIAGATMFFLSDLSGGVTGEIMFVDCGYSIMGFSAGV